MSLSRKLFNSSPQKYYDSIYNCTMYAFDKALSTGDLQVIHISGKYNAVKAIDSWEKIFNEYLKEFGLPETYKRYLKLMVKACTLYSDAYNKKDKKHLIVNAKLKQAQASKEISGIPESIDKTAARVARFMKMPIDLSTITVVVFHSYLEIMQDG